MNPDITICLPLSPAYQNKYSKNDKITLLWTPNPIFISYEAVSRLGRFLGFSKIKENVVKFWFSDIFLLSQTTDLKMVVTDDLHFHFHCFYRWCRHLIWTKDSSHPPTRVADHHFWFGDIHLTIAHFRSSISKHDVWWTCGSLVDLQLCLTDYFSNSYIYGVRAYIRVIFTMIFAKKNIVKITAKITPIYGYKS